MPRREASGALYATARVNWPPPFRAGESREGAALFGGGVGGTPQPLSAPLPAREVVGRPEPGPAHPDAESGRPTNSGPKPTTSPR